VVVLIFVVLVLLYLFMPKTKAKLITAAAKKALAGAIDDLVMLFPPAGPATCQVAEVSIAKRG